MLGLSKKESKFFVNSFVLHVLVLLVVGAIGLMPSCEEEKEEVHVFELASASFVPPPPPVYKPEPKPVPPVVTPVKPRINTPPKPKPKPVVKKPKLKPIVKPKPTPRPIVKPKPKPVVQKPKTISIAQFQKKHPVQSPPKVSSKPVKQAPRVRIDPKKFALPQITISNPAPQSTQVDPTILNRYLGAVKSKLEAVWRRLQSESNIAIEGEAFLSFKISSNGTLISPTISRSSGNQDLDRLVIQVSKSVGNLGRPPGGTLSSSLEIPFRVR